MKKIMKNIAAATFAVAALAVPFAALAAADGDIFEIRPVDVNGAAVANPAEPLDGGETGLDFYDRFVGDAMNVLKPGGAVFFEIGESQGEALRRMLADYGFCDIKVEKDFAGHDRYAFARLADILQD